MPIQNWRAITSTPRYTVPTSCTPYALPSGLAIPLATTTTILTAAVHVTPACFTVIPTVRPDDDGDTVSVSGADLRDPFYASSIPMAYSIAATTTLAYFLLTLLFLPNPPNSRPWLQKAATLSVCICLTIAFVETTSVLRREYLSVGSSVYSYTNEAREVRNRVVQGIHLKIGRLISDLFLWLAQVQTLIRLFPRQREKVVIKWAGFALILLDTLFGVLEAFVSPMASTDSFLDAIPALSYLFQICLSTMYAGCVIYYSLAKRRFSYFYPHRPFITTRSYGGRSMFLVAILSISSIITPIVFFVVDIAQKDLAGWGDYIRWVGAAASSVVVWEWVDRIEALEREDRKGGVLGREVYDEDEDLRFVGGRRDDDEAPAVPPAPPPPPRSGGRGIFGRRTSRTTPTATTESTRYEVRQASTTEGQEMRTLSTPSTPPQEPQGTADAPHTTRWPWKRPRALLDRSSRSTVIPSPGRGEVGASSSGAGEIEEAARHPLPASTVTSRRIPPSESPALPVHIIPAPPRQRRTQL
ncbi:PalH-domain-containing protein [Wilcoxina mikolae CBS 423.85]|nr:PalH-domain-containing protein [Wilcoxina mikolae CBS 423.85]